MFSITTPIYYVNDAPHLGHAYTTVLADALARYHRLAGEQVFFLTGVDEHGQKVQNALKKQGIQRPTRAQAQKYVDGMAVRFQEVWQRLGISNDDFIRTTQPRHMRVVQAVLQALWEAGQIYRGSYEGWYCVPDERFWTDKDLADTPDPERCPECGRPLERISEANYFFRMSAYQDWLVETIQADPDFIQPSHRRNEVLGFLRRPLGDLCISRPAARLSWGIPLPFDADYVTYVWFDALINYITAAGYLADDDRFAATWPHTLHLIGKDILTTHAVYWPIMLHAAGLPLPKAIFAHGWWVVEGTKMGKSLGNAVPPLALAGDYGVDAFRYFLLRDMTPGQDVDFAEERLAARYNADLANNLGNLAQRVLAMTGRYLNGVVPTPGVETEAEAALRVRICALPEAVFAGVNALALNAALGAVMDGLSEVNTYLERTAPWTVAKTKDLARVGTILYSAGEALRFASVLLAPALPERTAALWQRLGWQPPVDLRDGLSWGLWQPGAQVLPGEPLFPRREALESS